MLLHIVTASGSSDPVTLHASAGICLGPLFFVLLILLCFLFLNSGDGGDQRVVDAKRVNVNKPQNTRVRDEVIREYAKAQQYEKEKMERAIAELDAEGEPQEPNLEY